MNSRGSSPLPTTQQRMHRRGFTLLEMLIVLAILSAVVLWTWPALRRQLHSSVLRDAARQVRAELARARHKAVQTGMIQHFRFQPGKRDFEIKPSPAVAEVLVAGVDQGPGSEILQTDEPAENRTQPGQRSETDKGRLPDGAYFSSVDAVSRETAALPSESAVDPSPVDGPAGDENSSRTVVSDDLTDDDVWSRAIVFYPNGRTSSAAIRLANAQGAHLDVTLRGLTGVATVGRLRHHRVHR